MMLDKDMMKYKLQCPSGMIYFFAEAEHLTTALIQGGGNNLMKRAAYAYKDGKFHKNRSVGVEPVNMLLAMGRDAVNAFFDEVEKF